MSRQEVPGQRLQSRKWMDTIALTGSRRMSAVRDTTVSVEVEKDEKSHMTERILNLTLEILYLLTGEKYAAVRMTCIEGLLRGMYPPVSEGWVGSQTSMAVPPLQSPVLEIHSMEKIRDITNKLTELLTGEVPIRCQDVTDLISNKEDDCFEGHEDLIVENHPPLISLDGSTNTPQRCPRPLDSRDSMEEPHEIPHHYEDIEQINIKVEIKEEEEEMGVMSGLLYKEEDVPTEIGAGGNTRRSSAGCPTFPPTHGTDEDKPRESPAIHQAADGSPANPERFSPENSPSPKINPRLCSVAGSPAPSHPEDFYTNRSHATSNIDLEHADRSADPSMSDTVSNIQPGLLIPYRAPDPSRAEEPPSEKPQTASPNIIPALLIGYRQPDPTNSEKCSMGAAPQRAETQEDTLYPYFSSLVKMVEHQRTHGGDQLNQKAGFGEHQKKHLGKKVFPCVECEKFFADSADLDKHQRRHSREKPFSCSECGKSYTQKSHLVNHQRLHTGKNILPCAECGRCFTLKSQFIKHMRTHTGEKPYCCSECGRCFAQKSTLDNHQTIHTGQKPFSCSQCGKHFARKSTLQKHLELHASGVIALKSGP